jgi:glycosyltransferase involved in cell wall biosynthesis
VLATRHEVTIGAPNRDPRPSSQVQVRCFTAGALDQLLREHDITIASGYLLHQNPMIRKLARYLVMDVYGPFLLENLHLFGDASITDRMALHQRGVEVVLEQLEAADFLLCASERQRDYWLGALSMANRVNPYTFSADSSLRSLIDVVPFGLPTEPSKPSALAIKGVVPGIDRGDVVMLWTGGIWDWFDPLTAIEAVAKIEDEVPTLKLYFMGGRHPNPAIPPMIMARRAEELARDRGLLNSRVFFNDRWVPYTERVNYLCDADVAISFHHEHIETRFSFRTRFLDCLWTGLPILATAGDVLSDAAAAEGAGLTVADGDVDAVAEAMRALATDPDRRESMRRRSLALAQRYRWTTVAQPLLAYCGQPRRAADAGRPDLLLPRLPAPSVSNLVLAAYRRDGVAGLMRRAATRLKRWRVQTRVARH